MRTKLIFLLLLPFSLWGQITSNPVTFSDQEAIEIIFHAAEGNKGLQGYTGDVYAHTGVITDKSNGQEWRYAPTWGDNQEKYKLASLGDDQWKLTITPNVRTYYQVPEEETILKLAFVFRSADNQKEGKGSGGTDLFLNLGEVAFIPAAPTEKVRPVGITDGINYMDDYSVSFLLYAPGKKHVHLIGDFNHWQKNNDYQLYKDGDYWWYTLTGLEKGKEYGFQYLIDNSFKIGDAYAEKILDPQYDNQISASVYPDLKPYPVETEGIVSVFQTAKEIYNWKVKNFKAPAKEDLVIYEILIRDFTTEGTIMAVREKLDYLQTLGVNAIELMPIQEFDGNDSWGYNPCYFFAADKAYGTAEAYKTFIDEAHKRGMAVILDVVFNHATGLHPFAQLYWEGNAPSKENPWFNASSPHYYSFFNDFNHAYKGTRDYFKNVLTYWIKEYNLDGFRFDFTKGFTQKNSNSDATVSAYDASRIAILKEYNDHIRSIKANTYVILEHFCDRAEEKELAEAGMLLWNNLSDAYMESEMGWKGRRTDLTNGSYTSRGWDMPALITYNESHDEERLMYKMQKYGNWTMKADKSLRLRRAALGAAFLFCTPGPKLIWQFGELGYDTSIEENGRTGKKPVLWEYVEDPERKKLYDIYSTLIHFRTQNPSLFASPAEVDMQTTGADWDNGRSIRLRTPEKELLLLGNFTEIPVEMNVDFVTTGIWQELFSDMAVSVTDEKRELKIVLSAHSYLLFTIDKTTSGNSSVSSFPTTFDWNYDSTSGYLNIHSQRPVEQIRLYGLNGTQLGIWKETDHCSLFSVEPGIYILYVQIEGKPYSVKFIKQ
ncbi:alpha-amylase family glycosyl hydrolase [Parabacteroides sp. PF5-9]|uniref:alpha-amylase family glycosyl hydrolase n=1 Tax=Parabacteroides sp. PF5-9 TaxID=1742404 RepID=UPI002474C605|nr:alpha-amylase family glycosyl hydrolase [Parabacteroides sp. PF5-9]MDH6359280.1 1,4-alpha-glucan branching enzyme [Parabacteroides sp. PF5-9]